MNTNSSAEFELAVQKKEKGRYRRLRYLLIGGFSLIFAVFAVQLYSGRAAPQAQRQAVLLGNSTQAAQLAAVMPSPNFSYAQSAYPKANGVYVPYPANAPQAYVPAYTQTQQYFQPNSVVNKEPAEAAAMVEIQQLQNRWRSASSDQKQTLRASLNEAISKLFDARHASQGKQVEKLEAELAEAKELHKKRGERKNEIVERRMAELLDAPDDLAWNRGLSSGTGAPVSSFPSNQPIEYPPSNSFNSVPISSYDPYYDSTSRSTRNYSDEPRQSLPEVPSVSPLLSPPSQYIPKSATTFEQNPSAPSSTSLSVPQSVPRSNSEAASAPANSTSATLPNLQNQDPLQKSLPSPATATTFSIGALSNSPLQTSEPASAFDTSRSVIDAGYDLETALGRAIRLCSRHAKGMVGSDEVFDTERAAAKAQAIWTNLKLQMKRAETLEMDRLKLASQTLTGVNISDAIRIEAQREISRLKLSIESLKDSIDWAAKFESESLVPLQSEFSKLKPISAANQDDSEISDPANTEIPPIDQEAQATDAKPAAED